MTKIAWCHEYKSHSHCCYLILKHLYLTFETSILVHSYKLTVEFLLSILGCIQTHLNSPPPTLGSTVWCMAANKYAYF